MANSARRSINYTPRMTTYEAYEKLPPTLKRCLQEAVTEWCPYWTLREFEKHGLAKTIDRLHAADEHFMRKGFQMKKFEKAVKSSFVVCKIKPLRVYGITRNTRLSTGKNTVSQ